MTDLNDQANGAKSDNGKSAFVDQDTCIGCTLCTQLAPSTFEMEDSGKASAKGDHTDSADAIQSAIDSCPVQCISWKE